MRFISDIINDKREAAGEGVRERDSATPALPNESRSTPAHSYGRLQDDVDHEQVSERRPEDLSAEEECKVIASDDAVLAAVRTTPPGSPGARSRSDGSIVEESPDGFGPDLTLHNPFDRLQKYDQPSQTATKPVSPFGRSQHEGSRQKFAMMVDDLQPKAAAELDLEQMAPLADAAEAPSVRETESAPVRTANRTGRVKTRLLGFSAADFAASDPFEAAGRGTNRFPVGWLVVISEQGRGEAFALKDGVSSVGRGEDQTVCLDFGDNSISRENHASIAFDAEQRKFFIGQSGKANLVRLNNVPLLSTEELTTNDTIRLGQTTLRFVAFCGKDFDWAEFSADPARRE